MAKQISEVHLYQGVKFGTQVIKYVLLDAAFSDATQRTGNVAEIAVEGSAPIGVRVSNAKRDEEIIIPFNNVAYIKYVKTQEIKKAK
jgi:hypothetical protein